MANIKDELARLGIGKSTSVATPVIKNSVNVDVRAAKVVDLKEKLEILVVQTENIIRAVSGLEEVLDKLSEEVSDLKKMAQELKG